MKKYVLSIGLATLLVTGFSCKSKNKEATPETTTPTTTVPTEPQVTTTPPVIANDEELTKGATDATKDIKGLKAMVKDSVIYLSGTISKQDNMKVTPSLSSLHPKRIDRTNLKVQ